MSNNSIGSKLCFFSPFKNTLIIGDVSLEIAFNRLLDTEIKEAVGTTSNFVNKQRVVSYLSIGLLSLSPKNCSRLIFDFNQMINHRLRELQAQILVIQNQVNDLEDQYGFDELNTLNDDGDDRETGSDFEFSDDDSDIQTTLPIFRN